MSRSAFARFSWLFLAYLIAVILFGAWVRISGSGDGCGEHWPLCQGSVIPEASQSKTAIEFTHRITSGLCGIFGLVLVFWSRKLGDRLLFRASLAVLGFLIVESLIGAVLVKQALVAQNTSTARAVVIALHLANTLLLTASAATVAWRACCQGAAGPLWNRGSALLTAALILLLITNMTGAVTALGDTLFPRQPALDASLWADLRADITAGEHFLVRLRIVHPLVAVLAAMVAFAAAAPGIRSPGSSAERMVSATAMSATLGQVVLGLVNVALGAPGWMQILHLLMAQVVWLSVWLLRMVPAGASKPAVRAALHAV